MEESNNTFFSGSPKTMFFSGFVAGIAVLAVIAALYLANLGMSDGKLPAVAGENDEVPAVVADDAQPAAGTNVPAVTEDDHVRGDLETAKVVLVEYSDFQCPYCSRHTPTMDQIFEEYDGEVAWVFRHFPLSFHPNALPAAVASECAAEQGKFWEFHDELFANQDDLGDNLYEQIAQDIGMNVNDFNDCLDDNNYETEIKAEMAAGAAAGVSGTPGTFVNGELVKGAVPYDSFKSIVEQALAE
ncbi:MAG: thioredoxin domain-containing protein [Candidatus Uhrbacteria bacterium]|nr:DsbA family protein [Patescibacteria group bacterium]MBU1907247.1 DsbA family protein [Patescibacteria group bacterium]